MDTTIIPSIDWQLIVHHLGLLGFAYLLALPIGWEREADYHIGLRTFPLVAISSCGYLLIGQSMLQGDDAHARLLYGLMSGIGFIGGGAILKNDNQVRGTATAAAIWTTGAIGAAVAWQRLEIAIVLSVVTVATFNLSGFFKQALNVKDSD